MDKRVYLLTIVSFVVGMVELIIGGQLDTVASDLGISLGRAGLLITIFSFVYALAAPVLLTVTARIERKRLILAGLIVFLCGNIVSGLSYSYSMILIGRVITAASGSLLVVLCVTLASSIVAEQYRARAIGIVFMGVSGSLVLGVPIGLALGNAFSWRAPFFLIAGLTIFSMLGVFFFLEKSEPKTGHSCQDAACCLKEQENFLCSADLLSFPCRAFNTLRLSYTFFEKHTRTRQYSCQCRLSAVRDRSGCRGRSWRLAV